MGRRKEVERGLTVSTWHRRALVGLLVIYSEEERPSHLVLSVTEEPEQREISPGVL